MPASAFLPSRRGVDTPEFGLFYGHADINDFLEHRRTLGSPILKFSGPDRDGGGEAAGGVAGKSARRENTRRFYFGLRRNRH